MAGEANYTNAIVQWECVPDFSDASRRRRVDEGLGEGGPGGSSKDGGMGLKLDLWQIQLLGRCNCVVETADVVTPRRLLVCVATEHIEAKRDFLRKGVGGARGIE